MLANFVLEYNLYANSVPASISIDLFQLYRVHVGKWVLYGIRSGRLAEVRLLAM